MTVAINFPAIPGSDTPCAIVWRPDYAPEGADLIAICHAHPFDPELDEVFPAECGAHAGETDLVQGSEKDWNSADDFNGGTGIPTYIIDQRYVMRLDAGGAATRDPSTWEANTLRRRWNTDICRW